MSPQGMQKAIQSLPKEAQGIVTALQGQVTQLQQALQAAHLEIKYKSSIERGWMEVERDKVREQSATKIHDTETRYMGTLDKAHIDASAGIAETEIATAGKVIHEHVKGAYAKEAAKDIEKAADKAEKGNGTT